MVAERLVDVVESHRMPTVQEIDFVQIQTPTSLPQARMILVRRNWGFGRCVAVSAYFRVAYPSMAGEQSTFKADGSAYIRPEG